MTLKEQLTGINVNQKSQNQCLHFLIYPSFQGVNRLFVLSLESKNDREAHTRYFLLKVKIML